MMPTQQGTAPVAQLCVRMLVGADVFGDRLESMLASNQPPVASDQMAGMNVFTGQMPRRQMPRSPDDGWHGYAAPCSKNDGRWCGSIPHEALFMVSHTCWRIFVLKRQICRKDWAAWGLRVRAAFLSMVGLVIL